MVIEPAPFWANLYLYNHESKHITHLITDKLRSRRFYSTFRFTDNLCALNDGAEFAKVCLEIYPTEPRAEHTGSQATFLDLDISIDRKIQL